MIRSIVASTAGREVLGMVGAAAASAAASKGTEGSSPLASGQIAYLAVGTEELTLYRAKRGAFRPKATGEVIAAAPRDDVSAASVERGRLGAVLEVRFSDGQAWAFDVPKVHRGGAEAIASALAGPANDPNEGGS